MKVYIATLVTDYAGQMASEIDVLGTYATKEAARKRAIEEKKKVLADMKEVGYEKEDYCISSDGDNISVTTDYDGGYIIDIWEQEVK